MPPHFFAPRPLLPPRRSGSAPGTGPAERSVRKSAPGTDGRSAACGGYAAGRSPPQEIRPATADRPRLSVSLPYGLPNPDSSARRRTARPGRHPGIHARRQSGRTAPHPAQHPRQFRPGRRGRSGRIPRTPEGALLRPARTRHDAAESTSPTAEPPQRSAGTSSIPPGRAGRWGPGCSNTGSKSSNPSAAYAASPSGRRDRPTGSTKNGGSSCGRCAGTTGPKDSTSMPWSTRDGGDRSGRHRRSSRFERKRRTGSS